MRFKEFLEENDPNWLDKLQFAGDIGGVVDPTGVIDGANAAVSLGRAANAGIRGTGDAKKHLGNAGISALGMIPYVGDIGKSFKYARPAFKAANKIGGVAGKGGAKYARELTKQGIRTAGKAGKAARINRADQSAKELGVPSPNQYVANA